MDSEPIRILLVDSQPLFRQGVRWVFEAAPGYQVVGEAADGRSALQLAERLTPEVAVVDSRLPDMSGLDLTRQVRERSPHCAVLLLTDAEDDEQLFQALRAGAAAYASKDLNDTHLLELVTRIAAGAYPINDTVLQRPHLAMRVLDTFRALVQLDREERFFSPLTPRETQILDHVARGLSNQAIANALKLSDQTVKNHITNILRKLAVNDRASAVLAAVRAGWLTVPESGRQPETLEQPPPRPSRHDAPIPPPPPADAGSDTAMPPQ
jgi:DNA-binding NarL/FixJ family response regulator